MKIALPIRLLETADEEYATKGTMGKMGENDKGRLFRPDNVNEEFNKEYPEGISILGCQYEIIN